jgi:hypothetical protein
MISVAPDELAVRCAWLRVDIGLIDFDEPYPVVVKCELHETFVVDVP